MWIALRFSLLMMVLWGLLYPLACTGIAQLLFPSQANGSLVRQHNRVVGSRWIAQSFSGEGYFHPRPSAAGYNASNSGGNNWGVTNHKQVDYIQKNATAYQLENPTAQDIPIDAVTASGSGLDPDISLKNALTQIPRIAKAKGVEASLVEAWLEEKAIRSVFNSAAYISVLEMNLLLDAKGDKQ